MSEAAMTPEQIIKLFVDESEDITEIEQGEWEQDSKSQLRATVVQHIPSGDYWEVYESRMGSPWTDWDYGDTSATKVKPVDVVKTVRTWMPA